LSAGGKSFIDSDFILRFLNNKKVVYADCGLQFTQKGDKIFVKEINPFFHDYGIRVGDRILSVDGKTFEDVSLLSKYILFSKPYKKIDIKFQRKNRIFHKKIKLKRKLSGGVLGENYLAYIGLYLRYDLKVSYVSKGSLADKLGIKKGDKLLKINQTYIRSYPQVKKVLSKLSGKFVYLLFDRDDFQFFVHFRR
jgi:C-terminal processing protease CtpA/Prc